MQLTDSGISALLTEEPAVRLATLQEAMEPAWAHADIGRHIANVGRLHVIANKRTDCLDVEQGLSPY